MSHPPPSPKCYILYKAPLKLWVKLKTQNKTTICMTCIFKSASSWTNTLIIRLDCVFTTALCHRSTSPQWLASDCRCVTEIKHNQQVCFSSHRVNRVEQVSLRWSSVAAWSPPPPQSLHLSGEKAAMRTAISPGCSQRLLVAQARYVLACVVRLEARRLSHSALACCWITAAVDCC